MTRVPDDRYVIWSYEHRAWWAPDRRGYTPDLTSAGVYTRAEAERIVAEANANVLAINQWCLALEDALAEERTVGPRQ